RFTRRYLGTKRNACTKDAMHLRLRLAAGSAVARIHLSDMRRVRTSALIRVIAEVEIVVVLVVARKRHIVVKRRELEWCAALPAAEHPRPQQLRAHTEPCRTIGNEFAELRHFLLEAPEHH